MIEIPTDTSVTSHEKPWFEAWFDSDYYHILYKERNEAEAQLFLNNLKKVFNWQPWELILDLACGRGRHAHYLASLGMKVTGIDLSISSIAFANKITNPQVKFVVQDMRLPLGINQYNYILNLFTSFGYFENEQENILVLQHIKNALLPNGYAVIEYMNPHYVVQHLKENETKVVDDIVFEMSKEVKDIFLLKHIQFVANQTLQTHTERVMLIYLEQFLAYFDKVGFTLTNLYGDYNLLPYQANTSPRMIMVIQKKETAE